MSDPISRSSDRLVEMAALRAELEARREAQSRKRPRPVITVSREYGSLGAEIARRVADKLGFECWDQELVHEVATNLSKPAELLESVDEQDRSMVLDLLAALFHKDELEAGAYRRELVRVIQTLSKKGSAVIVGRGGQFIVPRTSALRVRVVAPFAERVAGIAERQALSREDAERRVREIDQSRAAFMRDNFGGAIEATSNYDLVLDSSAFSLEGSTTIIEHAFRAKFGDAE